VAENTPVTIYRTERVLTFMAASSIGLAILGILALVIVGVAKIDLALQLRALLTVLPAVGLILGVGFAIAFIIVSAVRRARAARDAAS
jgi:hypothetical protein